MSFSTLDLLELKDYEIHNGLCIREDRLKPGGFLIADMNSIIAVSTDQSVEILAGKLS